MLLRIAAAGQEGLGLDDILAGGGVHATSSMFPRWEKAGLIRIENRQIVSERYPNGRSRAWFYATEKALLLLRCEAENFALVAQRIEAPLCAKRSDLGSIPSRGTQESTPRPMDRILPTEGSDAGSSPAALTMNPKP